MSCILKGASLNLLFAGKNNNQCAGISCSVIYNSEE